MTVQAILFNKKEYTPKSSLMWLHAHRYDPLKIHETKNYYRYRLKEPIKNHKYITIKVNNID
jgi:hypothetical protein